MEIITWISEYISCIACRRYFIILLSTCWSIVGCTLPAARASGVGAQHFGSGRAAARNAARLERQMFVELCWKSRAVWTGKTAASALSCWTALSSCLLSKHRRYVWVWMLVSSRKGKKTFLSCWERMEKGETEGKYQRMGYIHVCIHVYIRTHKKETCNPYCNPLNRGVRGLWCMKKVHINKLQCQAPKVRKSQN